MLVPLTLTQPAPPTETLMQEISSFPIALVCMPFASAKIASIQIGLLTAIAQREGFETGNYYFNLDLAAQLGPECYEKLCEHRGHLTGEWLFAKAAFGGDAPQRGEQFLASFPGEVAWVKKIGKDGEYLIDLRERILPQFLDKCLNETDWSRYGAVGFSSTFQQNVACLGLARRIKEGFPEVKIIFGGSNMESEMGPEYGRAFPFVDYVVSGEADVIFPALLKTLASRRPAGTLQGVSSREPESAGYNGSEVSPFTDLDSSPVPNYEPYFARAEELGLLPHYKNDWALPVESSRGCWWGKKHHCTFCGLNGGGMTFRAKTPERFMSELSALASRHRISSFEAVDNILDLKYLPAVFSKIEENKTDYRFFYEVKANLTRAQIRSLYKGGVRSIQPGIESMSSNILKLMRKGCTMLQNVRCLKWCFYYNIKVGWNLLCGFPGETSQDYEQQAEVLKCIQHLEPPTGCSRIWLERFSPYYHDRESFPISNVRPQASYGNVYPEHVNLDKIAYFFDYEMSGTLSEREIEPLQKLVGAWQKAWGSEESRQSLFYRRTGDGILLDYKFASGEQGTYSFSRTLAHIYEFCGETMHTPRQVAEQLTSAGEGNFGEEEVREALDEFCGARLMLSEDDKYLSLAIPANPNW